MTRKKKSKDSDSETIIEFAVYASIYILINAYNRYKERKEAKRIAYILDNINKLPDEMMEHIISYTPQPYTYQYCMKMIMFSS